MQSFDLHVEQSIRVDFDMHLFQHIIRETFFVCQFDLLQFVQNNFVITVGLQNFDFFRIALPFRTDRLIKHFGQVFICDLNPTPLRDAVRFVVEFLRIHHIEIVQRVSHQNIRVQFCDAVDAMAADDGEIGHLDLAICDDGGALG